VSGRRVARRYNALRLVSFAQADRAGCAKSGVIGKVDCFVLPFTASVPVRNSQPRSLKLWFLIKEHGVVGVVRFLVGKELHQVTLDPKTAAVLAKKTLTAEEEEDEDEDDEKDEAKEKK
jgi:hypothetical protein